MPAPPKTSIYTEDMKNNGCIGIKKPGTVSFQWWPTKNGIDRSTDKSLENTLPSTGNLSYKSAIINSPLPWKSNSWKLTQHVSLTAQANIRHNSNSKTMMQDDSRNLQPLGAGVRTAANHTGIGKLTEKRQTITISTKSETTTDEDDKIWLPQMDHIDIVLPSSFLTTNQSSSTAAMLTRNNKVKLTDEMLRTEECINFVLNGPKKTKRLPIFEAICPTSMFSNTENQC